MLTAGVNCIKLTAQFRGVFVIPTTFSSSFLLVPGFGFDYQLSLINLTHSSQPCFINTPLKEKSKRIEDSLSIKRDQG